MPEVRDKSGFDKNDNFFSMHTFRASKELSEKHDEIYGEKDFSKVLKFL